MTSALAVQEDVSIFHPGPIRDEFIQIDTSCIDVSEVDSQEDKDFLLEKGENILRIVARAALEVGRELVEVQDHFKEQKKVGLVRFYESLGITEQQAGMWSCRYRAYCSYVELFGDDGAANKFNKLSDAGAQRLWNLPTVYREALLADMALGAEPTQSELNEISQRTEVKLSKAEELLAQAKARKEAADEKWELVKADPDIPSRVDGEMNPEYTRASSNKRDASKAYESFVKKVEELKAQIEAEKLKTAEEAEEKARLATELQRFKFDDAVTKAERIKRVGSSLTLSIPQTLADMQKFFTEKDEYPDELRSHLVQQAKILADYLGDQM